MSFCAFCRRVSKYSLIAVNGLLAIMAISFLIIALLANVGNLPGANIIPKMLVYLVVVWAIFTFLVTGLGIAVAFKQTSKPMLYSYTVMIVLIFIFQASVAVVIYTNTIKMAGWLVSEWNAFDLLTRSEVQNEFRCCGFSGPLEAPAFTPQCNPAAANYITLPGCYPKMTSFIRSNFSIAYIILFLTLSLEVIAFVTITSILFAPSPEPSKPAKSDAEAADHRESRRTGIPLDDFEEGASQVTSRSSPDGAGTWESKSDYPYPGAIGNSQPEQRPDSRLTFIPYIGRKTGDDWNNSGHPPMPTRARSNLGVSRVPSQYTVMSEREPPTHNPRVNERVRTMSPFADVPERGRLGSFSDRGVPQSPRGSDRRTKATHEDDLISERSYVRTPWASERGSERGASERGSERGGSERHGSMRVSERGGHERQGSMRVSERGGHERQGSMRVSERGGHERHGSVRGSERGGGSDRAGSEPRGSIRSSERSGSERAFGGERPFMGEHRGSARGSERAFESERAFGGEHRGSLRGSDRGGSDRTFVSERALSERTISDDILSERAESYHEEVSEIGVDDSVSVRNYGIKMPPIPVYAQFNPHHNPHYNDASTVYGPSTRGGDDDYTVFKMYPATEAPTEYTRTEHTRTEYTDGRSDIMAAYLGKDPRKYKTHSPEPYY
ncbi:Tetraspanin family-domain-containing protein [Jimgerdemannia flammicorona]|uniref:Tetraspanin family-domain-containing protein n=2 Tax=Jimgerdemannia flammicorona TaxID=994334 RepID=A0A433A0X0_9FUNG|nr:Tetraspanin family-domain-containing protein [Jimgerdemannia flammicorona]RUS24149.1 Tetraspanin family-domain-containing protein [Jimgerdemannia flammicorona]